MSNPNPFPNPGNPPVPGPPSAGGPARPAFPSQGGPPPEKRRRGLFAGLAGVVVVALVVVGGFVLFGGEDIDDLPAPKTLGRDPVPAEKTITKRPTNCGISMATIKALVPGAKLRLSRGDYSRCYGVGTGHVEPTLDVSYDDTAGPLAGKRSRVGVAIQQFQQVISGLAPPSSDAPRTRGVYKPLTGLGDDAAYSTGPNLVGDGAVTSVVFRSGHLLTAVTYGSDWAPRSALERFRRGAFRAATEVAKGLGVPAHPVRTQVSRAMPVAVPRDVCALVPKDLLKILGDGDDDPQTQIDHQEATIPSPSAAASTCNATVRGSGDDYSARNLEVTVDGATAPGLEAVVTRQYLAAYYEDRAERPTGPRSVRYFHALRGVGDQAFCAYLTGPPGYGAPPFARVVVRSRTALITVDFGNGTADGGLSEQQAIDGAYAVAVKVAAKVK